MMSSKVVLLACAFLLSVDARLADRPPMGWMSWEIFRCRIDPIKDGGMDQVISAALLTSVADALDRTGLQSAGYNRLHIDDCWMTFRRENGVQVANSTRFPEGIKAVTDTLHAKNFQFGIYSAAGTTTCQGYVGGDGFEVQDANTYAAWGVDYLKYDGCSNNDYFSTGYPKMGAALLNSGRDIMYSCSWPAYLGGDETTKNYTQLIQIGCNTWRNWDDIQCSPTSLFSVIDHYGKYGQFLAQYAGPGHWNDPDMLLLGNDCINDNHARSQMAVWGILAAPLILGNDPRNMTASHLPILLHKAAIDINQDALGLAGWRLSVNGSTSVWKRTLSGGRTAAALVNSDLTASNTISTSFADLGLSGTNYDVTNVWTGTAVSTMAGINVAAGDTAYFLITPQ